MRKINFINFKINFENTFVLFSAGLLLTGILYLALSFLEKESYIHSFFFRCWYIQAITTWLFGAAVIFVIFKSYRLKEERVILNTKVSVEQLNTIEPQEAKKILEVIPSKYRNAIGFRRIGELLRGYLHREEMVRLNQELSRTDVEEIERGHLLLNALKQLIPVLGFLGTVFGLSLGMTKFPQLSESAGSIESLRFILKDFAASLSVAFDTTLLALGYTVVLVLTSSLLRRKEESFVAEVDNKARQLITKLSHVSGSTETQEGRLKELLEGIEKIAAQNRDYGKEVVNALQQNGDALLKKLGELKEGLHKPPRYEIIVQPVEGRHSE